MTIGMLRTSPGLLGGRQEFLRNSIAWAMIFLRQSPNGVRVGPCRQKPLVPALVSLTITASGTLEDFHFQENQLPDDLARFSLIFTFKGTLMANLLARRRHSAYLAQLGQCYYCGLPMWKNDDLESFCQAHGLKPSQALSLQCTAEHLEARQDGGLDTAQNIVAACLSCNQRRHKRKKAPTPSAYLQLVRKRVRDGRWHCSPLLTAFGTLLVGHDSQGQASS